FERSFFILPPLPGSWASEGDSMLSRRRFLGRVLQLGGAGGLAAAAGACGTSAPAGPASPAPPAQPTGAAQAPASVPAASSPAAGPAAAPARLRSGGTLTAAVANDPVSFDPALAGVVA